MGNHNHTTKQTVQLLLLGMVFVFSTLAYPWFLARNTSATFKATSGNSSKLSTPTRMFVSFLRPYHSSGATDKDTKVTEILVRTFDKHVEHVHFTFDQISVGFSNIPWCCLPCKMTMLAEIVVKHFGTPNCPPDFLASVIQTWFCKRSKKGRGILTWHRYTRGEGVVPDPPENRGKAIFKQGRAS